MGSVTDAAYCSDFPDGPECCGSCHNEWHDGYSQELEAYGPGPLSSAMVAFVCCSKVNYAEAVLEAVHAFGLDVKDPDT